MATLKELARRPNRLTGGHRACAGCAAPVVARQVLLACQEPAVVGLATGCLEVTTTIYPYTAWGCSLIHNAFENVAATVSGAEAAYRALRRRGKIDREIRFIAFGGDGGTYDIGLQSLSGALERGHRMLYVCYDNGAYENTGIQRSSATPRGASTTTSPAGKVLPGKRQPRKDLTGIAVMHNIPYVAQTTVAHWNDLTRKVEKALAVDGPAFLNVLAPCRLGWVTPPEETMELAREAVECCFWPLYEVENGVWRLNYRPREKKSYIEWMKRQGRFKHLFQPGLEALLADLQAEVDERWRALLVRCGEPLEEERLQAVQG
ncbi:MAG: thiamine pyrophosphate-dependent enzyme [Bacillota bacterium]|nr:thiamine pyrophosphate-dependent enzyme [Bacillota bacterium]